MFKVILVSYTHRNAAQTAKLFNNQTKKTQCLPDGELVSQSAVTDSPPTTRRKKARIKHCDSWWKS